MVSHRLLAAVPAPAAGAQRASPPADDWMAVLEAPVDLALLHDVLHHIENPAAYFKGLPKYLKATARIVIVDYLVTQGPYRDDPSLQVGKEEAATLREEANAETASDAVHAGPGRRRCDARRTGDRAAGAAARTLRHLCGARNPCVTAHSTVRPLSSRYAGPLYQVNRADGQLLNIGVIAGGFADAAAQDRFCAGTLCYINRIYDVFRFECVILTSFPRARRLPASARAKPTLGLARPACSTV